jgi:hypothetical protein
MTRDADGVSRTMLLGRSLRSLPAVLVTREHALAEFRSLRSRNLRRGTVERPGPFQPRPAVWSHERRRWTSQFQRRAYLPPSARPLGLSASGRASPFGWCWVGTPRSAVARATPSSPRAKRVVNSETRTVSPAAEAGEGRGCGAVLCGAGHRPTVVSSSAVTPEPYRAGRGGGGTERCGSTALR